MELAEPALTLPVELAEPALTLPVELAEPALTLLDQLSKALAMLAGWVINLAVAEWIIRTRG